MLAVRLREHHQLDVGRVAAQAREDIGEVGDFPVRKGEALRIIDSRERRPRIRAERDTAERSARMGLEQSPCLAGFEHQRFGHRVEKRRRERG
jgi:hypothetical protein